MSFKAAENKVQGEGYSKKVAAKIIAKSSMDASPAAKRANPKLKKVGAPAKRHMEIDSADDGSVITRTSAGGRDRWDSEPTVGTHRSARSLTAHVNANFPIRGKKPAAAPRSQFSGIAAQMLKS